MKDYSQWGEQQIILDFFGRRKGTFLDIGACDFTTGSNTRALAEKSWTGLCIEADAENFCRLIEATKPFPKVTCLNAAVSGSYGVCELRRGGQLSSCIDNPAGNHQFTGSHFVGALMPMDVGIRMGWEWDFVSIDIEGAEPDVIPRCASLLSRTSLVCFEDAKPFHEFSKDYYQSIRLVLEEFGFTEQVGRTTTKERSGNTLLARPQKGKGK